MPIYEYHCEDCRRKVSVFFRTMSEAATVAPQCPRCAGLKLHKLVSKVAFVRSDESRMEGLDDPSMLAGLESEDPRAMANFVRKMSDQMGEPLDPELTEVVGRLEKGESAESIEQSMPALGESAGGGGGDAL